MILLEVICQEQFYRISNPYSAQIQEHNERKPRFDSCGILEYHVDVTWQMIKTIKRKRNKKEKKEKKADRKYKVKFTVGSMTWLWFFLI